MELGEFGYYVGRWMELSKFRSNWWALVLVAFNIRLMMTPH